MDKMVLFFLEDKQLLVVAFLFGTPKVPHTVGESLVGMEYRKFVGRVNVCYDECFDFLKKISFENSSFIVSNSTNSRDLIELHKTKNLVKVPRWVVLCKLKVRQDREILREVEEVSFGG
jgi:hypothetical protein